MWCITLWDLVHTFCFSKQKFKQKRRTHPVLYFSFLNILNIRNPEGFIEFSEKQRETSGKTALKVCNFVGGKWGRGLRERTRADNMWYSLQLCCLCPHIWALIRFIMFVLSASLSYLLWASIPIGLGPVCLALRLSQCCLCNSRSVACCVHTLYLTLDFVVSDRF